MKQLTPKQRGTLAARLILAISKLYATAKIATQHGAGKGEQTARWLRQIEREKDIAMAIQRKLTYAWINFANPCHNRHGNGMESINRAKHSLASGIFCFLWPFVSAW